MLEDNSKMKVPKGYFDAKQRDLMQIAAGDEDMIDLSQDAPLLISYGRKEGFSLPENYFHSLESKLNNELRTSANKPGSVRIMYYAAAACLLCLFGYFGLSKVQIDSSEVIALSSLDTYELEEDAEIEEAYSFLLAELDGFSDEELLYEEVFLDFKADEESKTDNALDIIINDLLEEYQVEDFEDIF